MAEEYSAIFAGLALALSIFATWKSMQTSKTTATLDIWKAWISKDYRQYRIEAFHAIRAAKKSAPRGKKPKLKELLADRKIEEAVGSIEHLFADVDSAITQKVIDRPLFTALFGRSVVDWEALLDGFDRLDAEAFTEPELHAVFHRLRKGMEVKASHYLLTAWRQEPLGGRHNHAPKYNPQNTPPKKMR